MIAKIVKGDPIREMAAYKGKAEATSKKIITNVFTAGDAYFRSGDILSSDEDGWLFFMDRVGDTFRYEY